MNLTPGKKITVTTAPISGPRKSEESDSEVEGHNAGQADEEAGLFNKASPNQAIPLNDIPRILDWYRSHLRVVGELVLRNREGQIAAAKTAHDQAAHELREAESRVNETGVIVLSAAEKREAAADRVIRLYNPELVGNQVGQPPADASQDAETPPRAFRHILERKMPMGWGYAALISLALAEGALNVQAFAATGEGQTAADALAVLVGIGIVAMAHLIGGASADLLENLPKAQGRSPLRMAQVAVGVPALVIGILGVAVIRASYFADQNSADSQLHLHIPTPGLVALAFMLAAAAIIISMAMHNPFADDLERQDKAIEDHRHHHNKARERLLAAQDEVSITGSELWRLLFDLVREYGTQTGHVYQCAVAYRSGYSRGAKVSISGELPEIVPPGRVAQALAWLDANPYGTLAPPTLPYSVASKPVKSEENRDADESKRSAGEQEGTMQESEKDTRSEDVSAFLEDFQVDPNYRNNNTDLPDKDLSR